jgi:hypothetical protein
VQGLLASRAVVEAEKLDTGVVQGVLGLLVATRVKARLAHEPGSLRPEQTVENPNASLSFNPAALRRGGHAAAPHAQRAIIGRRASPAAGSYLACSAKDAHGPLGTADPLLAECLADPREPHFCLTAIAALGGVAWPRAKRVLAPRRDAVSLAVGVDRVDPFVPERRLEGLVRPRSEGLGDQLARLCPLGRDFPAPQLDQAVLDQGQLGPLGATQLGSLWWLGRDLDG